MVTEDLDLPAFSEIELTGVANFYITTGEPRSVLLKAQQNIIDIMTWEVTGETLKVGLQKDVTIDLTGVGNVRAYSMKAVECTITSSGIGDCEVYMLDQLTVTITGVGNVYYKGNPSVNLAITGIGDLVNAN